MDGGGDALVPTDGDVVHETEAVNFFSNVADSNASHAPEAANDQDDETF